MKAIKPFTKPVSKQFTTSLTVWTLAALFLLSMAAGTARAEDIIKRTTSPKPLRVVRVTLETYEEVRYRQSGVSTEQKLSADKVIEITYGDAPGSYNRGKDFFDRYDYENAVNSFKLSMEESGVRDWIKTYALFWIGKSYQAWGASQPAKYADAIKSYEDLLTQNPMTRFYPEVLLNLASCYAQSGDISSAVTTYDRLAKEAYDKKLGVIWEARSKYEKAASKLAGGQLDESERDFRSAETFCTEQAGKAGDDVALVAELNSMAGMARLSQGLVMIKRKRYKEAQDFFKQILNNPAESRVALAGAQNGLAECYLAEGNLKEAQLQFATAKVRYGGITEEAAKATYFLGRCALELKDKEPQYKKKANDYFEEVIAYYPSTTWAKEAQKMLK